MTAEGAARLRSRRGGQAQKSTRQGGSVPHPSLVDRLVDHVSGRIVSGDLPPGAKVTEEEIASDFGVSRTPVREAVKRLAELGLIVVRPRRGLEVVAVDERDVREITQLRAELETFALRLAMPRMTLADIRELEAISGACEALLGGGNRPRIFRADSRWHLAIAACSGNRHLEEALRRLDVKVQLCRMFLCLSDSKVRSSVRFHRRILAAIRKGDAAGAEGLLREHISAASSGRLKVPTDRAASRWESRNGQKGRKARNVRKTGRRARASS